MRPSMSPRLLWGEGFRMRTFDSEVANPLAILYFVGSAELATRVYSKVHYHGSGWRR